MAKYVVIKNFTDRDRGHKYEAGKPFPKGGKVSKARLDELMNHPDHNGTAFIAEVEEEAPEQDKVPEPVEEPKAPEETKDNPEEPEVPQDDIKK